MQKTLSATKYIFTFAFCDGAGGEWNDAGFHIPKLHIIVCSAFLLPACTPESYQ